MIQNLQIINYKSISGLHLNCSRINVLIGEPNVGKSNILEALDLSFLSWMLAGNASEEKAGKEKIDIKKYFRVDKASDLFYDADISKPIIIDHPDYSIGTKLHLEQERKSSNFANEQKSFFEISAGSSFTLFDNDFNPVEPIQFFSSPIAPYRFKENIDFHDVGNYMNKLMPPFGNNLLEVIKHNGELRTLISELIQDVGLELNIDISNHRLLIQKKKNPGVVYSMKYEALADTIRRIIFYIAAIRYNNSKVITLEEPDAHAFPKYVSFLGDEIIKAGNNQFFIATHNPYLLNNLIENTPTGELAVFICGYDKIKGTIAHKLTMGDLSELLDYGVDIFLNINRYLDDGVKHSS